VADEPTLGELARSVKRIETTQRESQKDVDDRLSELARKTVPAELWAAEHRAALDRIARQEQDARDATALIERTSQERMASLVGQISAVRKEIGEHKKAHADTSAWSRNKKLIVAVGILGASATIAAAWIAAALAAGGLH